MKKERYVQLQNPMTKDWVKVDTKTAKIIGTQKKKFNDVSVYKKD